MKQYTESAKKSLQYAENLSLYTGKIVESIHLLIGITENTTSYGAEILQRLGFDSEKAKSYLLRTSLTPISGNIIIAPTVEKILNYAETVVKDSNRIIDTHHIILSIAFNKNCSASKILSKNNITYERILSIVESMNHNNICDNNRIKNDAIPTNNEFKNDTMPTNIDFKNDEINKANPLEKYGVDLSKKAEEGKIDKLIGREKELEKIIRILGRKRKNNPIIVGESGVGKTALVEGLAKLIYDKKVPDFLINKRIISINLNSIVSGTKYRGEMEEKLEEILTIAEKENIILFIDELHCVISSGNSENGTSIGNILKPAISNENIMIIGTTTHSEYSKYIEKDTAFERRFMKIVIDEPSVEQSIKILLGLKTDFESHYNITISDKAIEHAVKLSVRYMQNQFLPDKAIDLIDEACSHVTITQHGKSVNEDDVKKILSETTGIPINNLQDDNEKILNLEKQLSKKIIGQNEAIHAITQSLIRSQSGLREGKKPIGSFIFLGNTGEGKTETAKVLAEELFGDEKSLIRVDMSEYMDKNSINRLVGAPPGYVGYDEGGYLTESVKKKPYSIILLDEIEKAHLDIFNILLQVLDDGRLTDSKGRTIDFKNTIIIMTSNAGTDLIKKSNQIGFGSDESQYKTEKDIQISALKSKLKPELINRVDSIIVFNKLSKEDLREIANIILERKRKILFEEKGINLIFDNNVSSFIVAKAYDEAYGARPLKRTIENLIENKLSEMILEKNLKETEIFIKIKNEAIVISDKQ